MILTYKVDRTEAKRIGQALDKIEPLLRSQVNGMIRTAHDLILEIELPDNSSPENLFKAGAIVGMHLNARLPVVNFKMDKFQ